MTHTLTLLQTLQQCGGIDAADTLLCPSVSQEMGVAKLSHFHLIIMSLLCTVGTGC